MKFIVDSQSQSISQTQSWMLNQNLAETTPLPDSDVESSIIPNMDLSEQVSVTSGNHDKSQVMKHSNVRNRRKWDKRHRCLYCCNLYAKMARHLEQKYKEEIEVIQALSFDKGSKERKRLLQIILHKGAFKHNKTVTSSNKGFLFPAKRHSDCGKLDDFTTCDKCFGLFFLKDLWRHKKKCPALASDKKKNNQTFKKFKSSVYFRSKL